MAELKSEKEICIENKSEIYKGAITIAAAMVSTIHTKQDYLRYYLIAK